MHLDLEVFKKHPVASIGGAILVFIIVYYLANSGSSSSASISAGGVYGYNANDLAYLQLQAAQTSQANQIGGQIQQATIQAGVANNQIAAQVQSNSDTLAAQIAAAQLATQASIANTVNNNQTQVQLATIQTSAQTSQVQIQAQENEAQTSALAGIVTSQTQAQVDAQQNQLAYLYGVAQLQAGVASQGLTDQTTLETQALAAQTAAQKAALGEVTNIGGSQNRLALIQSILGQPGAAAATEGSYASVSNSGSVANIINSVGNSTAGILSGLLA